jgi:guanylate kinase
MAKSAEEMSHWPEYDYVIVNDTVEQSIAEAQAIVTAERLRRPRQTGLADFVDRLRNG